MALPCSLLMRFVEDTFDEDLGPTIGVDFKSKMIDLDGNKIKSSSHHPLRSLALPCSTIVYCIETTRVF